ncbi:MAG: hypothetical protein ABIH23_16625 [bacterium]
MDKETRQHIDNLFQESQKALDKQLQGFLSLIQGTQQMVALATQPQIIAPIIDKMGNRVSRSNRTEVENVAEDVVLRQREIIGEGGGGGGGATPPDDVAAGDPFYMVEISYDSGTKTCSYRRRTITVDELGNTTYSTFGSWEVIFNLADEQITFPEGAEGDILYFNGTSWVALTPTWQNLQILNSYDEGTGELKYRTMPTLVLDADTDTLTDTTFATAEECPEP